MGVKIGSDGATTRESLEPPCVNKDCLTNEKAIDAIMPCL
jgi:hypothetical protein